MKTSLAGVVALISIAACAPRQVSTPPSYQPSPQAVDSARTIIRALVERDRIPGLAITVSVGRVGKPVVWREGFGFADVEKRTPAGTDTQFRIGSVSKLLTAVMLQRMAQSGVVDLDVAVGSYLTSLPPHLALLTLRQLAGHVGGIRHYRGNEFLTNEHYDRLRDAIRIFAADTLVAPAGTRYAYSSYGYNLIGAVLEEVTGKPFPELVARYVTRPLEMDATVPDMKGASIARRAHLYSVSATEVTDVPEDDLSGRWPSGGYLSTTDDLARLGRSVLANGLLNDASLRTMFTPQVLASGTPTSVGIGWRVSQDSAGRRYYHHGGTSNGGAAFLLVYPDRELVIAIASNALTRWGERDALAIAAIFLSLTSPSPAPPAP